MLVSKFFVVFSFFLIVLLYCYILVGCFFGKEVWKKVFDWDIFGRD